MFYFISDVSFMDVCKIVLLSGVEIYIMILNKFDYFFVYWVMWFYVGELLMYGVYIYFYEKGFLYVKMIVVDNEVFFVGMMNIDL